MGQCEHILFYLGWCVAIFCFVHSLDPKLVDCMLKGPYLNTYKYLLHVCIWSFLNFVFQHSLLFRSACLSPGCRSHQCEVDLFVVRPKIISFCYKTRLQSHKEMAVGGSSHSKKPAAELTHAPAKLQCQNLWVSSKKSFSSWIIPPYPWLSREWEAKKEKLFTNSLLPAKCPNEEQVTKSKRSDDILKCRY